MKIVFIRHGEPDKAEVDKRGFTGQGRHMACCEVYQADYSKDFECFGWV